MSDALKQKEELLSSKDAGKLLGYTHDYISKLCREGKMNGVQKGRVWYVTEKEVKAFQQRHEAELAEKKAQLSQKFSEIRSQHETKRLQNPSLETSIEEKVEEKISSPFVMPKMVIPRQFVAAGVLALALIVPSLMNSISYDSQTATVSDSSFSNIPNSNEIVEYFDVGVATVISVQSDLVLQTANTFSFVQYLNNGYWELANTFGKLSQGLLGFLNTLSDGYLTFYLLQGQIVYNSIIQMESMGASVISGYELMGKSLVVGGENVIDSYKNYLNIDSNLESSKKKLTNFSSNTTEGLAYAHDQVSETIANSLVGELKSSIMIVIGNVKTNISYIKEVAFGSLNLVTASITNTFSFDMLQKDEVRKVELNQ